MATGSDSTEKTTKLLIEQKQLFCKLLLLEIEKYEQHVKQIPVLKDIQNYKRENNISDDKPFKNNEYKYDENDMLNSTELKWLGFKSFEQVEHFGRSYYHGVLSAITNNEYFDILSSEFPNKYLDQNVKIIVNGVETKGLSQWISYHNKFVGNINQCYLAEFNVISWIPYSFSATFIISIIFSNNKKCENKGTVSVVMSEKDKKIITAISTSDNNSFISMRQKAPK